MKTKYLYLSLFALAAITAACTDEDALTPSKLESITSKFEFPQGNTELDDKLVDIYERFGVKVIYKDFEQDDWVRSWTSGGTSLDYQWDFPNEEALKLGVDMLANKVFPFVPEELANKTLQSSPYFFLIDGLRQEFWTPTDPPIMYSVNYQNILTTLNTLDSKTVSVYTDRGSDDYSGKVAGPVHILNEILKPAFEEGLITLPNSFYEGVNYEKTPAITSYDKMGQPGSASYDNYWARRGFCPTSAYGLGRLGTSKSSATGNTASVHASKSAEMSRFFMYLCLEPNLESRFEEGGLYYDCPLLEKRFRIFIDHFKNEYGIDVREINRVVFEGYTGDLDPDRKAGGTSVAPDFTAIYN